MARHLYNQKGLCTYRAPSGYKDVLGLPYLVETNSMSKRMGA